MRIPYLDLFVVALWVGGVLGVVAGLLVSISTRSILAGFVSLGLFLLAGLFLYAVIAVGMALVDWVDHD